MNDSELSEVDELVEMESRTNSDGSVEVTIEEWDKISSSRVKVSFELIDTVKSEKMAWPEAGESFEDNKFRRLVESCGLDMRNADLLEGSDARAVKNGASWELVVPSNESVLDRNYERLTDDVNWLRSVDWKSLVITTFWIASVLMIMVGILGLL